MAELAQQVLGAGFVVEIEAVAPPGADLETRLLAVPGVTAVQRVGDRYRLTATRDVRPDAARAVVTADGALTQLSVDTPSLEAIYTRFFQRRAQPEGVRDAA